MGRFPFAGVLPRNSFTKIDRQTFEHLDGGTRKRLMDKTAARRKGAWKKLYEQLAEFAK